MGSSSAAFFDLDRTLLRRSSALALAPAFRRHGIISRGLMLKAALWQVLFMLRGASHETVRAAAEDGLVVLKGHTPDDMRAVVADSMETVLRPLVYAQSLDLVERHRRRGEPVYIVSATLQEIVEAIAEDLGFDGALGTVCEVVDGKYTGKAIRALHAQAKADCISTLDFDLDASTAYSDSHTDLPFLEAVGHPVAVNPDKKLRAIALARGWPIQEFRGKS